MPVQLKKKYQCLELIEELDELIAEAVGLFDDSTGCTVSGYNVQKIERFETIIMDHLIEKTDFESTLESIKTSFGGTFNLLCKIKRNGLKPTFSNFLSVIDDEIKELKKIPIKNYTFYVPVRIKTRLTNIEKENLRKNLNRATNLTVRKLPNKVRKMIPSSNFQGLFANREIILKGSVHARDYISSIKWMDRKISAFLGAIAFSKYLYRDTKKWSSFSLDMSIANDPSDKHFLIIENNHQIVYPETGLWDNLDIEVEKDVSLIGKETWDIHNKIGGNYQKLITVLGLLSKQDAKMKEITEESLKLYLEAITEKHLEISFLKFWIITERILKKTGKISDERLKSTLKGIIKESHLKKMIDVLYKKRNDLVHEFEVNLISQQDRNLAKATAELTILLLINPPTRINNVHEFQIMIDNISSSKEELKTKKKIITTLFHKRR